MFRGAFGLEDVVGSCERLTVLTASLAAENERLRNPAIAAGVVLTGRSDTEFPVYVIHWKSSRKFNADVKDRAPVINKDLLQR